jgi:hypothetical protein
MSQSIVNSTDASNNEEGEILNCWKPGCTAKAVSTVQRLCHACLMRELDSMPEDDPKNVDKRKAKKILEGIVLLLCLIGSVNLIIIYL